MHSNHDGDEWIESWCGAQVGRVIFSEDVRSEAKSGSLSSVAPIVP